MGREDQLVYKGPSPTTMQRPPNLLWRIADTGASSGDARLPYAETVGRPT